MLNGSGIKIFSGAYHLFTKISDLDVFDIGTSHPELAEIIARR